MAFDPQNEDYLRLALSRHAQAPAADPYAMSRDASAFSQQFSWGGDGLATTDEDRAFHLTSEAAEIIDGELPFVNYDDGELLAATARRILDEALALDPFCPDARRLVHAQDSASLEDHLQFLEEGLPAVRRDCEARAAAARRARIGDAESEVGKIAAELALAPCQRWLQSLAELSLLGGRYGRAIDYARECLALDPKDPADARWTAALAFAKLDDGEGLVAFVEEARLAYESRPAPDAWLVIARLALAWKAGDDEAARNGIGWLLATYPMAGTTLTQLAEVPEPMFARLAVAPHSEDELVMAVSEAAVLFQEGADESGLGPIGAFVVHDPRVEEAFARERELFGEEERADEDAPAMGSEADER